MAEITSTLVEGDEYSVEVREPSGSTRHRVTVTTAELERFGAGAGAVELLEESFRFLLEREPKESILGRFEISVIARYFPDYPSEIRRRLGSGG